MTVRDADRFKDKIEVSLDSRQIFFLFFGAAVGCCLVFVLGVMVGRRLEQREHVASRPLTSAAMDPLAALDELGADEESDDLSFPVALAGEPDRDRDDAPKGAKADSPKPVPVAAAPAPDPVTPPPVAAVPKPEVKPEAKPETVKAAAAVVATPTPAPGASAPVPAAAKVAADPNAKPRFTLQVSSFRERSEAEALASQLATRGFKPAVTESNVEDKGVFFRVRLGRYATYEEALEAKASFEKSEHLIAYVTRL